MKASPPPMMIAACVSIDERNGMFDQSRWGGVHHKETQTSLLLLRAADLDLSPLRSRHGGAGRATPPSSLLAAPASSAAVAAAAGEARGGRLARRTNERATPSKVSCGGLCPWRGSSPPPYSTATHLRFARACANPTGRPFVRRCGGCKARRQASIATMLRCSGTPLSSFNFLIDASFFSSRTQDTPQQRTGQGRWRRHTPPTHHTAIMERMRLSTGRHRYERGFYPGESRSVHVD